MRTSIELDDRLFRELKRRAAVRGTTLRQVVNELLCRALDRPEQRPRYRFNWKVDPLGTIQPGVRLNHREFLFDLMGGR
ncbi:MAG: type II toxin-antitoxin system VapB family antitoxin [Terriglobia bacterium]